MVAERSWSCTHKRRVVNSNPGTFEDLSCSGSREEAKIEFVKSIVVQSPYVGVVWKFRERSTRSGVMEVNIIRVDRDTGVREGLSQGALTESKGFSIILYVGISVRTSDWSHSRRRHGPFAFITNKKNKNPWIPPRVVEELDLARSSSNHGLDFV
ncbi:hypothetical protein TNCV_972441 [Trichonephila clavipes]|nr:hypothetical protein TNCV_972441 [Trichonephila clavipes]